MTVEIAMTWNDSYHESTLVFTNNIPQRDGGTHLAGFRAGLTRVVTKYADDMACAKKDKTALTGDDCREGLTCVAVGQGARPEILLPDQGQAGVVGSAPDRGRRGDRPAGRLVRDPSRRGQDGGGQGGGSCRRPRSRPQGARTDPAQGRAGRRLPARQAGRLPGTRSRPNAKSSSSRATRRAAAPSRPATAPTRRCCRCAARS